MRITISHYGGTQEFEQIEAKIRDECSWDEFASAVEKVVQSIWGNKVELKKVEHDN